MSLSAAEVARVALTSFKLEEGMHAIFEVTGDGARVVMTGEDPYDMLPEYAINNANTSGLQAIGLLMQGWALPTEELESHMTSKYARIADNPKSHRVKAAEVMMVNGKFAAAAEVNGVTDVADGEQGGPIHELFSLVAKVVLRVK